MARVQISGRTYQVFQIDTRAGALRIKALSNRRTVQTLFGPETVATVAGVIGADQLGYAAAFDTGSGLFLLNEAADPNRYSLATGVADDGTIVGYELASSVGSAQPARAFRYTKQDKFQYLDAVHSEVRRLYEQRFNPDDPQDTRTLGTRAWFINGPGIIYLQSPRIGNPGFYLLDRDGRVKPAGELRAVRSGQVFHEVPWFNAAAEFPPDSQRAGALALANTVNNDLGGFAGPVYATNDLSRIVGVHREGSMLPGSADAIPTSMNLRGEVAAYPGLLWDAQGTRTDLRQVLWSEGRTTFLRNSPATFTNGLAAAFVNNAGDLAWNTFFLRRECPEVDLSADLVEGFVFAGGKIGVKAGGRFKARARLSNPTSEVFRNVRVELHPPSPLFRQVGQPVPSLPSDLSPGATAEAVFEWEALQSGVYEGAFAFFAESSCGAYEKLLPAATIHFQDSPLGVGFAMESQGQIANRVALCTEFEIVASVTNLTKGVLTNVAPVSAPTNNAQGRFLVLQSVPPTQPLTLRAGESGRFRWRARAGRLGLDEVRGFFSGAAQGIPFRVGPERPEPLEIVRTDFVVNETGDQPNADPSEACPDIDPSKPGLQVTLRAAIQSANTLEGPDVIRFEVPGRAAPEIQPASPLPPITEECRILGNTQAGGWVGVVGGRFSNGDGTSPVLELRGNVEVRGLAFTRFDTFTAVSLAKGLNTVAGCRFGLNAAGQPSLANRISLAVFADGSQIGGTGATDANHFLGGEIAVAVAPPPDRSSVNNVVVEGNVFGKIEGAGGFERSGPGNAVALLNARGARVGGLTPAARNHFAGARRSAVLLGGAACTENSIVGNWFGLRKDGSTVDLGEQNRHGVALILRAHHNRIGGLVEGSRNILSACQDTGILVSLGAHDNAIEGNWIGLNARGTTEAGNGIGIWLVAGANTRIGGPTPSHRNLISGNLQAGILIGRPAKMTYADKSENPGDEICFGTLVEGNWIGLDPSGSRAEPNGRDFRSDGVGVEVHPQAEEVTLGSTGFGTPNVIAGNQGPGIRFLGNDGVRLALLGNRIGLSSEGSHGVPNHGPGLILSGNPNAIVGGSQPWETNRIAFNDGPGVDLRGLKPGARPVMLAGNLLHQNAVAGSIALASRRSAPDPGDGDSGPNGLQNSPVLLGAYNRDGASRVVVDLSSFKRGIAVRLDLFRAAGGGGDQWLATTHLVTGQTPKDRHLILAPLLAVGSEITALSTTLEGTSEFSPGIPVYAGVDTDGDGIPDDLERDNRTRSTPGLAGAQGGDINADGVPDAEQGFVASARIPGGSSWISLAAPAGHNLSEVVALAPGDVGRAFGGQVVFPGALHFATSAGAPKDPIFQLWFQKRSPVPTLWWSPNGASWTPIAGVRLEAQGSLTRATFPLSLPPGGIDGWLAVTETPTVRPGPVITVWAPEFRSLGYDYSQFFGGTTDQPGLDDDLPRVRVGRVVPMDVEWPADALDLRLETSLELTWWEEVPVWPAVGSRAASLSWPFEDRARFFRWQP